MNKAHTRCSRSVFLLWAFVPILLFQIYLASQSWPLSKRNEVVVVSNSKIELLQSTEFSPTLIVPTSFSNILYTNTHIYIWEGAIMIPVAVTQEEDAILRQYIKYSMFPSRVYLITFEVSVSSFPVNTLRSIAVKNCPSTHVLITTAYTIPSIGLYSSLFTIPVSLLNDPHRALIVPTFPLGFSFVPCDTWYDCKDSASYFGSISKRYLYHCINWGSCRDTYQTPKYKYVPNAWFSLLSSNYSTPLTCWNDDSMNPFVLVKKSTLLPDFDRRFNYEDSSMTEWVMELRYSGFHFHLLSHGWFLEITSSTEPANGNAGLSRIQRNKLTPAHLTRAIQRSIRKKYKNFHSLPPCD